MKYKGDTVYIEQVLEGRTASFSFIVDHHKDKAFNLAFRICGNAEDAEEIAQDSFMKAFRSLSGFRMKSSFSTWFYRIVYNTAITYVRSRKKGILSIEDFPAEACEFLGANVSEEEAEKDYRNALVSFALQRLSEEERGLISLFYYEDLGTDEISGITGLSRQNIKVKLFRARQKMLEVFEKAEKKKLILQ